MRYRIVDFTMPFMVNHIAAFIKKKHASQFNIRSIADLARQSTVKYAVLAGGSTEVTLRGSRLDVHVQIWAAMHREGNASRVRTIQEGIGRVVASTDERPWAFLSESLTLRYNAGQRCDVEVIVDPLSRHYLSLAVSLSSEYRDRLSLAILYMLEDDEMNFLRRKWWHQRPCRTSANAFSFHSTKRRALHLSSLILAVVLGLLL